MGGTASISKVRCFSSTACRCRQDHWGRAIVIDQRVNKGGEAVASPQVFEMNYFRKP